MVVREWQPDIVIDTHTHPFDTKAIFVRGEMWLSEGNRIRRLARGGSFRLRTGTPHGERYESESATYRVARTQSTAEGRYAMAP